MSDELQELAPFSYHSAIAPALGSFAAFPPILPAIASATSSSNLALASAGSWDNHRLRMSHFSYNTKPWRRGFLIGGRPGQHRNLEFSVGGLRWGMIGRSLLIEDHRHQNVELFPIDAVRSSMCGSTGSETI